MTVRLLVDNNMQKYYGVQKLRYMDKQRHTKVTKCAHKTWGSPNLRIKKKKKFIFSQKEHEKMREMRNLILLTVHDYGSSLKHAAYIALV